MSNPIAIRQAALVDQEFSKEQLELIKATVAKNATNDELKLFLYRCKNMGLDPLKPGQIYFVKYGSAPGTIVVGIDGFRSKADRTGKHAGTNRGILRDEKGKCLGAWCEVYRKDWIHPAREEVSLAEYTTGKAMWAKMPETMLKKVAEAAALRMAFPDELGGVYAEEEMLQAAPRDVKAKEITEKLAAEKFEPEIELDPPAVVEAVGQEIPDDYIIKVGKNKGKQIKDLSGNDVKNFRKFYEEKLKAGENMHPDVTEYYDKLTEFVAVAEVEE